MVSLYFKEFIFEKKIYIKYISNKDGTLERKKLEEFRKQAKTIAVSISPTSTCESSSPISSPISASNRRPTMTSSDSSYQIFSPNSKRKPITQPGMESRDDVQRNTRLRLSPSTLTLSDIEQNENQDLVSNDYSTKILKFMKEVWLLFITNVFKLFPINSYL